MYWLTLVLLHLYIKVEKCGLFSFRPNVYFKRLRGEDTLKHTVAAQLYDLSSVVHLDDRG